MPTSHTRVDPVAMGFVHGRPAPAAGLQLSARILQKRVLEDNIARGELQMHTVR